MVRPQALLYDEVQKEWLAFSGPRGVIAARRPGEVAGALRAVEEAVAGGGRWAAGFVAYEAAPAFDQALTVRREDRFPLLWFGIYGSPARSVDIPSATAAAIPPADWRPSVTAEEYRGAIGRIKEYIRSGDTYQVNYTYRLTSRFDGDPFELFAAIAPGQRASCAAFIDAGEWALCSASPELFFRLDGDTIESRPMKGTAPRGLTAADDLARAASLRASAKERAENVMIVDMVRNDCGRIAETGTVEVASLYDVEKYPTLWQMTSTVRAKTRAGLAGILGALFPPASVTGAPKPRTMAIIAGLESSPRRAYTGTIGFWGPGRRAQFNVAIRTVLVDRSRREAEYGVGGGIVWDSTAEGERDECATKARILAARRPEFNLLETMRWSPGEGYFLLEKHLARLAASAGYFDIPLDQVRVREEIGSLARRIPPCPHRVRLLLDREGGVAVEAAALAPRGDGAPLRVAPARAPVDPADPFLYHKTTRRRVYEEAREGRPGFDDVILYNGRGEVTESTIANVAVEIGGVLCTPPVSCGLLPGTFRELLLERGEVRERPVTLAELRESPRVVLFNSVRGVYAVSVCG